MISFFDYFQLATLAIFLSFIVVRAIYLRVTANINPIAVGRGKKGFALFFELYAFVALAVWVVEMLLYAFHASFRIFPWPLNVQLIDSDAVRIAGVAFVTLGIVVYVWALVSFGKSWRVGFDVKTPGKLVTTGIFAITRNPIYLFLDLWFIGIFLINGRVIFLIFAILAVAHLHYQIIREEKFLTELYGQSYKDYRNRTRRYI